MSVMIQRLPKAARKRHPGLNFSGSGTLSLSDVESLKGSDWGISGLSSSPWDCDEGVAMVWWLLNKMRR
jgi:hypothetical protein